MEAEIPSIILVKGTTLLNFYSLSYHYIKVLIKDIVQDFSTSLLNNLSDLQDKTYWFPHRNIYLDLIDRQRDNISQIVQLYSNKHYWVETFADTEVYIAKQGN